MREISRKKVQQGSGRCILCEGFQPAGDRDELRKPAPQHESLDQLVLQPPLQMAMLVESQVAQQLANGESARASGEAFDERQRFAEPEVNFV